MSNEIKVMKEFIKEFHPFYDDYILSDLKYHELVDIVKEITKGL